MKTMGRGILSAVFVAMMVSACQRVSPPNVELQRVRLGGIGLAGSTLIAELQIDNPNDFAIEADSITFQLEAKSSSNPDTWSPVTSGVRREPSVIEAGQSEVVQIPIELSYSSLGTPVRSILERGTFTYRVSGRVSIREPRRTSVPFTQTGNLSMTGSQ